MRPTTGLWSGGTSDTATVHGCSRPEPNRPGRRFHVSQSVPPYGPSPPLPYPRSPGPSLPKYCFPRTRPLIVMDHDPDTSLRNRHVVFDTKRRETLTEIRRMCPPNLSPRNSGEGLDCGGLETLRGAADCVTPKVLCQHAESTKLDVLLRDTTVHVLTSRDSVSAPLPPSPYPPLVPKRGRRPRWSLTPDWTKRGVGGSSARPRAFAGDWDEVARPDDDENPDDPKDREEREYRADPARRRLSLGLDLGEYLGV